MDLLFKDGKSFNAFPLKMICLKTTYEMQFPAQAMFVAPKRSFKLSPDRNKIKRRIREAYRLNKQSLYTALKNSDSQMVLAFIYTGKKIEDYAVILRAIQKLLEQAAKQ